MPRDPYQWGRSSSGPFGGKARSEVQSKWQSRSTDPVGGVLEPRSRALLYPQEAGCAQRVCPRLHPRCPLRPCRAVSTTRGRAQDSRNAAGLRAHQNASFPLLAPNAEGLCPEQQVALQASCPPLPSFPRCGQPSVFPAFTGTQPLSPRSLPRPRNSCLCFHPFPEPMRNPSLVLTSQPWLEPVGRVQRPVMDMSFTINPLNPASLICLPTAPTVDFEQSFSSFSCNSPAANSAFCLPAFLTFSTTE